MVVYRPVVKGKGIRGTLPLFVGSKCSHLWESSLSHQGDLCYNEKRTLRSERNHGMANHSQGKYWSPSLLKSRGWTNELISTLLPKPRYRRVNGRSIPAWHRDDVRAAEETEVFRKKARGPKPGGQAIVAARSAIEEVVRMLDDLWSACPGSSDDPARILAGHYHRVILDTLPSSAKGRVLRPTQVSGYLTRFLALEKRCDGSQLPGDLTHFVQAGVWMGEHLTSPLMGEIKSRYPHILLAAAAQAIREFTDAQPEADLTALLRMDPFPAKQLLSRPLGYLYSVCYVPQAIRTSLQVLMALNPKDEYPEARAMSRHFVLHIGGTNTGKTYAGFQRLKQAGTGVYLAPLRLLALEAQEILLKAGVDCSLTTGEEEDRREEDTHVAATAEKLDLKQVYEVAVIDECQMIADRQRGYAWTRAILGVRAPEIHLCAAPEAKDLLLRLIESCGDSYEVELHRRQTPLLCMSHTVDYTRIQPGDALITFSKVGVLSVAEDLRQAGKEPAIIYGALPYATRRKQMEGFLEGRMEYVVSTDAIGMGLNLPIRRIIFMDTEKFDGVERRELKPEEIQQIAGRAGRYGMYDRGYVGATQNLGAIRQGLNTVVPHLRQAVTGFSDLVLMVDFDLLEVLTEWNRMPTADPYIKLDISRYITIISKIREMGFSLSKEQELRAANIPFDETEEPLRELFFRFLRLYQQGETIEQPGFPEGRPRTLPELELFCRKLDLYFSFAKAFGCPVDEDALYNQREDVAEEINEILLHRLKNNIRFCARCGAAIPLHHHGRLCEVCFQKQRRAAGGRHRESRNR